MARIDGRKNEQLREVSFIPEFIAYPEGSVLIAMGGTRVMCNVTIEETVPNWIKLQQKEGGWITGEYALLPRSTHTRTARETAGVSGRTHEIKRLIGRALRSAVDLRKLGPRTCTVDCDVLQADGGTRSAAVTGGYVALAIALGRLIRAGRIPTEALRCQVAAVSAGIVGGEVLLDLSYEEDRQAAVDFNVVMDSEMKLVEIQGTAEGPSFSRDRLNALLECAERGIRTLLEQQRAVLARCALT